MPRKVFFSFHYQRDAWRVAQVRNSNIVTGYDKPPFLDAGDWEQIRRQGDSAIKKWIDDQLNGTSVTVVLIGRETSSRPWVRYEIEQSWIRGNGIIGIYIHDIKNHNGEVDWQGQSPFDGLPVPKSMLNLNMRDFVKLYDWVRHDGRANIGYWIEEAARQRGK